MHLAIDTEALKPLVAAVVEEVLARVKGDGLPDDRLAFGEAEAARLIGLNRWQLRDERRRGRISGTVGPGRRIFYSKADISTYLASRRTGAPAV